jgi:hypothetical protein
MGHANEPVQLGLETWTLADFAVPIQTSPSKTSKSGASDREFHVAGIH